MILLQHLSYALIWRAPSANLRAARRATARKRSEQPVLAPTRQHVKTKAIRVVSLEGAPQFRSDGAIIADWNQNAPPESTPAPRAVLDHVLSRRNPITSRRDRDRDTRRSDSSAPDDGKEEVP